MAYQRERLKQYHLVVAENFLRNISLDGTFEDTSLRIFNQPGLDLRRFGATSSGEKQVNFDENVQEITTSARTASPEIDDIENEFLHGNQALNPDIEIDSPRSPGPSNLADFDKNPDNNHHLGISMDVSQTIMEEKERGGTFSDEEKQTEGERRESAGSGENGKRKHKKKPLLQRGISSPLLPRRKPSWRDRLTPTRRHRTPPNNFPAGKKTSFRTGSKTGSKLVRKNSAPQSPTKSSGYGHDGIKLLKKLSNFLQPPSPRSLSRAASSNTSDNSLIKTYNSEESLSGQSVASSYSRGELRFLTTLRSLNIKSERDSNEHKKSRLSNESEEIKPFDLGEDGEISYCDLLVPYNSRFRQHQQSGNHPQGGATSRTNRKLFSDDTDERLGKINNSDNPTSRASSCEPTTSSNAQNSLPNTPKLKNNPAFDLDVAELREGILNQTYHSGFSGGFPMLRNSLYHAYDPNLLDNPEFGTDQHKTTLSFPGYITSVYDYVDASEAKKAGNEKFRLRFPHVNLTYSKLKSIKRDMRKIILGVGFGLLTLAQAYVYFEKIILRGMIGKNNRKLVAAACLVIASKLNDSKGEDFEALIAKTESVFRASRKEFMPYELPVVVGLDFNLHLPDWEIYPHYQKLVWAS